MRTIPGDIESVNVSARTQPPELEIHLLGMFTGACYLGWFKADKLPPTNEVWSLDTGFSGIKREEVIYSSQNYYLHSIYSLHFLTFTPLIILPGHHSCTPGMWKSPDQG